LEGHGSVAHDVQDLAREASVVLDARLSHQGGVGGEALDPELGRHGSNAVHVGAVGKDLHAKIASPHHRGFSRERNGSTTGENGRSTEARMRLAASARSAHTASGASTCGSS